MSLRPDRSGTVRFAVGVAGDLVLSGLAIKPIARVGVSALVVAPNAGKPAPPPVEGEVRVEVGPPAAVLSLAVVDAPNPRATVFVLHGIRDSKESLRGWGEVLADQGYRAILVDLRGHGRSTGEALTYGVLESADLVQALDSLDRNGLVAGPVGVMGHSYGAATAIQWAGRDPRVRSVIAVAPFASLRAAVPGYTVLPLPSSFVDRVIALAGASAGFDPDEASPVDAIARTSAAVLLIHGRRDARIPSWHSERIFAAGADHAELVLIETAGHESVVGARETRLADRSAQWFDRHLR
jgi:alpha-beta hydrolase superfamily lysophospholipase